MAKSNVTKQFQGGGKCDICDLPAVLVVKDLTTGLRAGKCCAEALALADAVLDCLVQKNLGICHPSPEI